MEKIDDSVLNAKGDCDNASGGVPNKNLLGQAAEIDDSIITNTVLSLDQVNCTASEPSNSAKDAITKDSDQINVSELEGESTDKFTTIHDKSDSHSNIGTGKKLPNDSYDGDPAMKVDVPDGKEKISSELDTLPEINSVQEEPPLKTNNESEIAGEDADKGMSSENSEDNIVDEIEIPNAASSVPPEAAEGESIEEVENTNSVAVSSPNKGTFQSRMEQKNDEEVSEIPLVDETPEKSQPESIDSTKIIDDDCAESLSTKDTSRKPQNAKKDEEDADLINMSEGPPKNLDEKKRGEATQSPAGESSAQTEAKTPMPTAAASSGNPSEEDATLNSETGDEEQVMQEFLHVSAKDKDLDDPMSLDAGEDESMEVTGQTEEDPFGLPDLDTNIPDEPMDVDETSNKEKSSTEVADIGEKEVDEAETETDRDADVTIAEPAAETSEATEEPTEPTESPAGDSTNTDTAVAVANTSTGIQEDDFPGTDADEEICIIPDTIRVPAPGTPIVIPAETAKETAPTKTMAVVKTDTDSLFDSLKDSNVTETASDKVINKKEPASVTAAEEKGADAVVDAVKKPTLSVNRDLVTVRTMEKEPPSSIECTSDDILDVLPSLQTCFQCKKTEMCKYQVLISGITKYVCDGPCTTLFRNERNSITSAKSVGAARSVGDFTRKCAQCTATILLDERNLSWETMDFCNEDCLGKYQTQLGSFCANCKGPVAGPSLGKYCVRFGYDIKQFCCSLCLEEYKKGLKVCSYCQKDISNDTDGFLAPVGDKGQFKDFCTQKCMEKYDYMSNNQPAPTEMQNCDVCANEKIVRVEVIIGMKLHKLCSDPCFAVFKFVNKVDADQCEMCKKYFDKVKTEMFSVYYNESAHDFCSKTCMNVYILANRKIVPCNWCKVKKYNFDMIKRISGGHAIMMCSLNCLMLFKVSINAVSSKKIKCDYCLKMSQAQYHLTMSDATIRNFCQYDCVMAFQGQYTGTPPLHMSGAVPTDKQVIPTGQPKRNIPRRSVPQNESNTMTQMNSMPVISSVKSLAPNGQQASQATNARGAVQKQVNNVPAPPPPKPQVVIKQQVVITPAPQKEVRNKGTSCRPIMTNKGVSCRPTQATKECQTDDSIGRPIFIPVPIPIFVPAPMAMYSLPFPMPVPFPVPVPVPMFIPTTRSSAKGILKDIKRIREKMPTDPFEAELLMMAEMVAGEKKPDNSDSDSDDGDNGAGDINEVAEASSVVEEGFSPEAVDTSNFGEDMLQMALKMASELDEPAVDLEESLTPSTITAQSTTVMEHNDVSEADVDEGEPPMVAAERSTRGRKRQQPSSNRRSSVASPSKRGRRVSSSGADVPLLLPPPDSIPAPRVEVEKPDAHMCLKFTFGVNAWRQWVNVKNAELEKGGSNARKAKLFKPEILQLTSDELNYSLCLFVKEVRKPNNTEYAPDTIYYLVLGIQQYLFENGRIDNIFTDSYYEKFTECLDEVAKKFSLLFNDQQYIVTRVEEEHLWESKQLGAHSPHVLLSTLMFFNTKHFNLTTVEEHMQLSFSHIMKHWKRNPNQPGATKTPGSRNVLLRFYPPQAALEANSRKKKVYEQQENEENPLRCPVKLYEFYLSKCPESVKTRNDVFYLLPERSCVPDSPVWYSTMALSKEPLMKMLHRVKMVKEINMALLTS